MVNACSMLALQRLQFLWMVTTTLFVVFFMYEHIRWKWKGIRSKWMLTAMIFDHFSWNVFVGAQFWWLPKCIKKSHTFILRVTKLKWMNFLCENGQKSRIKMWGRSFDTPESKIDSSLNVAAFIVFSVLIPETYRHINPKVPRIPKHVRSLHFMVQAWLNFIRHAQDSKRTELGWFQAIGWELSRLMPSASNFDFY